MKKRLLLKFFMIFLMSILTVSILINDYSYGTSSSTFDLNGFQNQAGQPEVENAIRERTDTIVVLAKYIAVTIAIIILIVIGMKYMISSPADRADIKKHAVPYVIGAGILFGTSTILQIIQNITNSIVE